PAGSKLQKFITRLPGWEGRLTSLLRIFYKVALHIHPCPKCNVRLRVFKVRNGKPANRGRLFLSCKTCSHFEWVPEDLSARKPPERIDEIPKKEKSMKKIC